ncbi:MAG: flagellar biosynthesis protein FlhB [Symbiobacteriaceae bacterium]|nr:flagellar biosynthesis protein FlhB [Symbiobacteriaceae bacterium]
MLQINLQLFAGGEEKTEEPTLKRREDARKKGQVAKSSELVSAIVFLMVFAYLRYFGFDMVASLAETLTYSLSNAFSTLEYSHFVWALARFAMAALPILGVALVTGVAINIAQVGIFPSSEPLAPNFDRLNPVSGFQRIFSKRSLVELAKSLVKLTLIAIILWQGILSYLPRFMLLMDMELALACNTIIDAVLNLAMRVAFFQLLVGVFDYWFQWRTFEDSIRMTKQEIKDEMKQTEGNPQTRARVRERQRSMSMRRMMQELPKADVVITNPEHFAVALRYAESEMQAPQVVAKGQDFLAQQIKAVALQHQIIIVEDKPLAQALYQAVEIGDYIPPEFYSAVAELLAYVYRVQGKVPALT